MWFRPAPVVVSGGRQSLTIGFLVSEAWEGLRAQMIGGVLAPRGRGGGWLTGLWCGLTPPPCGHCGDCRGEPVEPGGCGPQDACWPSCLTDLPSQDMENKIRSTLNEIYFGKTKDIVTGLR